MTRKPAQTLALLSSDHLVSDGVIQISAFPLGSARPVLSPVQPACFPLAANGYPVVAPRRCRFTSAALTAWLGRLACRVGALACCVIASWSKRVNEVNMNKASVAVRLGGSRGYPPWISMKSPKGSIPLIWGGSCLREVITPHTFHNFGKAI